MVSASGLGQAAPCHDHQRLSGASQRHGMHVLSYFPPPLALGNADLNSVPQGLGKRIRAGVCAP